MDKLQLLESLNIKNNKKIIFLVIDGLGGITHPEYKMTELEAAHTVNLDNLVKNSLSGLIIPVGYGITPGSGPSHLALFGYDPFNYEIGRGILEALGLGIEIGKYDLCARANFATIDYKTNIVIDRRASRPQTEKTVELCKFLQENINEIDDIKVTIKPGRGHRFVVVFTGENLSEKITDNDPQKDGYSPKIIKANSSEGEKTSKIVNKFLNRVTELIKEKTPMNYILIRGFSKYPDIPSMNKVYGLNSACIAVYPMYKGLAKLVGMKILDVPGEKISDEITTLKKEYNNYDFFYVHIKETDTFGEDGNFLAKVNKLNEIDGFIPEILELNPDVLVITGDHATPSVLKGHSWHFVPVMIYTKYALYPNISNRFTERECLKGYLGILPAKEIMSIALANTFKLSKFGA